MQKETITITHNNEDYEVQKAVGYAYNLYNGQNIERKFHLILILKSNSLFIDFQKNNEKVDFFKKTKGFDNLTAFNQGGIHVQYLHFEKSQLERLSEPLQVLAAQLHEGSKWHFEWVNTDFDGIYESPLCLVFENDKYIDKLKAYVWKAKNKSGFCQFILHVYVDGKLKMEGWSAIKPYAVLMNLEDFEK